MLHTRDVWELCVEHCEEAEIESLFEPTLVQSEVAEMMSRLFKPGSMGMRYEVVCYNTGPRTKCKSVFAALASGTGHGGFIRQFDRLFFVYRRYEYEEPLVTEFRLGRRQCVRGKSMGSVWRAADFKGVAFFFVS